MHKKNATSFVIELDHRAPYEFHTIFANEHVVLLRYLPNCRPAWAHALGELAVATAHVENPAGAVPPRNLLEDAVHLPAKKKGHPSR